MSSKVNDIIPILTSQEMKILSGKALNTTEKLKIFKDEAVLTGKIVKNKK